MCNILYIYMYFYTHIIYIYLTVVTSNLSVNQLKYIVILYLKPTPTYVIAVRISSLKSIKQIQIQTH